MNRAILNKQIHKEMIGELKNNTQAFSSLIKFLTDNDPKVVMQAIRIYQSYTLSIL